MSSLSALRDSAPVMAKCLVFAPRTHILHLSDLWQLHLACEAAVSAASEPLLAAMRLQWFYDALTTANVPHGHELLSRLAKYDDKTSFIKIVTIWQEALQQAGISPQVQCETCYSACFVDMARICTIPMTDNAIQIIRQIGVAMAQSKAGLSPDLLHSTQEIRTACGSSANWLIAINETVNMAIETDVSADNLLIFKLFWRVYIAK